MFSVYQSWQQVVSIVSVVAMDRCVTVGFMEYEGDRCGFLSSVQALMTLTVFACAMLVCLFTGPVTYIIGLPPPIVLALLAVSPMNNTLANWAWLQRYKYRYRRLAFVTVGFTATIQVVSTAAIMLFPTISGGTVLIMSSTPYVSASTASSTSPRSPRTNGRSTANTGGSPSPIRWQWCCMHSRRSS